MSQNTRNIETFPPPDMKIPPKRNSFAEEYCIDGNGTQAAIRAGYSEKSAKSQAARLLTFGNVIARIEQIQAHIRECNAWDQDKFLQQLADDHQLYRSDPKSAGAAVRCLELMAKITGVLDEKGKPTDPNAVTFNDLLRMGADQYDRANLKAH